jgi:hypothetical protein
VALHGVTWCCVVLRGFVYDFKALEKGDAGFECDKQALCGVMWCYVVLCGVMRYCVVLCGASSR